MRKYLVLYGVLCSSLIFGQQSPLFTQYMFNLQAANAAYAGSRQSFFAAATHRAQWVGFSGAPKQSGVYMHSAIGRKPYAVGFQAVHESVGAHRVTGAAFTYAYHLRLNRKKDKLGMAIRAGGYQYGFDYQKLSVEDNTDPNLLNTKNITWVPTFDLAFLFHNRRTYAGIELNQLLNSPIVSSSEGDARLSPHLFIVAGHAFELNQEWDFKPSILMRFVNNAPLSAELNAAMLYKKQFWMGLGYRYPSGIIAIAQFMINESFKIGYSYDFYGNKLRTMQSGTHEITLSYEYQLFKGKVASQRFF